MKKFLVALCALLFLSGCSQIQLASHLTKKAFPYKGSGTPSAGTFKVGNPYKVAGKTYYPREDYDYVETGIASWYGPNFHGKATANGEIYNQRDLTAAHRTLQIPSLVRVTNLDNGRAVILRVNDRGPFSRGRIIDVSERGAELLGFKKAGTAKVKVEVLKEESLQIAEIAKSGQSTKGYEIALNRGGRMPQPAVQPASGSYRVASADQSNWQQPSVQAAGNSEPLRPVGNVTKEVLTSPAAGQEQYKTAIPGERRGGAFYPDPVVTETAVTPTNIYVQAGAFTQYDNAVNLSRRLKEHAQTEVKPAMVNGRQFYRVRLGPVESVAGADQILASLVAEGNNDAMIVVD